MHDRVQSFLHYMSAERGASRNTIDAYRNDLSGFVGFAGEQDGSKAELTPGCIDRELVTGYIAWLGERSYAASTTLRPSTLRTWITESSRRSNVSSWVITTSWEKPVTCWICSARLARRTSSRCWVGSR